ncbi:hypothetical protein PYW07_000800 [Mythimna separata]|uniref:Uncharacterized protein n=1 Tax=Mythimna separata TaxID=271217 RepID=A0AAD8DW57_MYTSE|nr:hypothetical protein PYW07_000800 [Mythimna separata]
MSLVLFHLSVISLYSFAFWYDQKYVEIPYPAPEFEHVPFNARAIYFTFWTLVLQNVYFIISLLNDFFGTNAVTRKPPLIRQLKDVLFSVTLCMALYVVIVFWVFYTFAKDAIFPEIAEKTIPVWLNHVMHTLILPFILIELLVTNRNYPSTKTGSSVAIILAAIYTGYIHFVYFKHGIWPYPFLHVVSWTTKIFYFIGSTLLGILLYLLGEKFHSMASQKPSSSVSHMNGSKKAH